MKTAHGTKLLHVVLLPALALGQAVTTPTALDDIPHLRVQRVVRVPHGSIGLTCAVLDADVYAHAEGESLNDLRLFALDHGAEVPFALVESNTDRPETDAAEVRNVKTEGDAIGFDLEMPKRPYTAVNLLLNAKNFVGLAKISGRDSKERSVDLGAFAIFDLSARGLSRSTMLPLQESSFTELHVQVKLQAAPGSPAQTFGSGIVQGATVPPSRAAQTVYTPVAESTAWTERGQEMVATIRLQPHVPVVRALFTLPKDYSGNFLRGVVLAAKPDHGEGKALPDSDEDTVQGVISQVHLDPAQDGTIPPIQDSQLAVDAVLAANLRGGATVEITVLNGNQPPLPLRSVQLEMRERRICFQASARAMGYTLMYGAGDLPAPVYDYGRLFNTASEPSLSTLGPEQPNPAFAPPVVVRPFAVRHPDLLWLGSLTVLAALGSVVMRNARYRRGGLR